MHSTTRLALVSVLAIGLLQADRASAQLAGGRAAPRRSGPLGPSLPPNAEPARQLVVIEASVDRSTFLATGTPQAVRFCLTSTNRFSDPLLGLLPDDHFAFRLPSGCGVFDGPCTLTIERSSSAAPMDASDFTCSVSADAVTIDYIGMPKSFVFEDRFCAAVQFSSATAASCTLDYRFVPRTRSLPPRQGDGVHRIANAPSPTAFTLDALDPMGGPAGPAGPAGATGATGPSGATGPPGPPSGASPCARLYYLTTGLFDGDSAVGACQVGFHFASLSEFEIGGRLDYDPSRGVTVDDLGRGEPCGFPDFLGWVRSGRPADAANCQAWTSSSGRDQGVVVACPAYGYAGFGGSPSSMPCSRSVSVWCIQD